MAEAGWLRHALAVGRFEFRRSVRKTLRSRRQFAGLALGIVLPTLTIVVSWWLVSGSIPAGWPLNTLPVPDGVFVYAGGSWLFGTLLVAQRTASVRPRIDAQSFMLTTVSARTVAAGLWFAELFRILAYVALPVVAFTLAVADLLTAPAALVTFPLAVVLFVASVVTAGSLLGYAVVLAINRIPTLVRYRAWLSGTATVAVLGIYVAARLFVDQSVWTSLFTQVPLLWLVDVATLGVPFETHSGRAAVAVVVTFGVVAVGAVAIERVVSQLWYQSPASVGPTETEPGTDRDHDPSGWLDSALTDGASPLWVPSSGTPPTARTAQMTVLQTLRNPRRLSTFALFVLVVAVSLLNTGVQYGGVPPGVVLVVVPLVPWLVCGAFELNPLGDQQAVLPVTLTAVSPREFVRGVMVPGVAYGIPAAVVVTVLVGVLSPLAVSLVVPLTTLAVYLTGVSAAVCPAVGIYLPRFSAISVGQSDEVLPPRTAAVVVSVLLVGVPGGYLALLVSSPETARALCAGLVGYLPAALVGAIGDFLSVSVEEWVFSFVALAQRIQGIDPTVFQYGMGGLFLAGGVVTAIASYRRAVRWVDGYDLS